MLTHLINECDHTDQDVILKIRPGAGHQIPCRWHVLSSYRSWTIKERVVGTLHGRERCGRTSGTSCGAALRTVQLSHDERMHIRPDVQHPVSLWLAEFVSFTTSQWSQRHKDEGVVAGIERKGIMEAPSGDQCKMEQRELTECL